MTHSSILVHLAVTNFKVILPPEIFVVHRVVAVDEDQMFGQGFHVFELGRVDEGLRWRHFVVMIV